MAFSRTPTEDTASSQRINLTREINARDGGLSGKDEDLLNVFIEPINNRAAKDDRSFIVKRAGAELIIPSVGSGSVRGTFFWENLNKYVYAVEHDLYVYDVDTDTSATILNVFPTTTDSHIDIAEYLYEDNTDVLLVTDGTTLSQISTTNVVTVCVDADMPAHLPYMVVLDGYLFIVKIDTADIYNSDLNNPLSWDPAGFISAEMEADFLIRLAKVNNYIIAMGKNSIEYFWDAANEAPGSPLQRNDTPIKLNTFLAGFAQYGNVIYYIGVNESGQPDVYELKDFSIKELASPTVSRYLNAANSDVNTWTAGILSCKGHTFYIINAGTLRTYVMDLDTKLWSRWAWKQTATFPIQESIGIVNTGNAYNFFCMNDGTANIYRMNDSLFQDSGINFTCIVTTEASDFGTLNRKTMRKLALIADRPSANANVDVSWSDDDYQTFSIPRSINLNQDLPCIYNLGWFRQRCFKLIFTANHNLRLQEMEADINKGR
jgi:hypothetical protein